MINFKATLEEFKIDLKKYLVLYKKTKDNLGSEAPKYEKIANQMLVVLKIISNAPDEPLANQELSISQIANTTRLQLETYLNSQEKHADLDIIEQELNKLEQGLSEWKKLKEQLNQAHNEDEWNGIHEITQQARQQINYLKEQKKQIMLLIKDYKKVAKNPKSEECIALREQLKTLIDESEAQVKIIK